MATSLKLLTLAGLLKSRGAFSCLRAARRPADPGRDYRRISARRYGQADQGRAGLCRRQGPDALRHGHAHAGALGARSGAPLQGRLRPDLGAAARSGQRQAQRRVPARFRRSAAGSGPRRCGCGRAARRTRTRTGRAAAGHDPEPARARLDGDRRPAAGRNGSTRAGTWSISARATAPAPPRTTARAR